LFRGAADAPTEPPASVADRRRDDGRVTSAEGAVIARLLADVAGPVPSPAAPIDDDRPLSRAGDPHHGTPPWAADVDTTDDSDMLVIEDDVDDAPMVFAVAATDYRRLFSRLRRGGR